MENLKKKKPEKTVNRVKTSGAVKMGKKPESVFTNKKKRSKSYDKDTVFFGVTNKSARGRAKDRAAMLRYTTGVKAYARKSSVNIWKVFIKR